MLSRLFGTGTSPRDDMWARMSSVSAMLDRLHSLGVPASARRQSGIIYAPDASNPFLTDLSSNLDAILYEGPGATKTATEIRTDDYGMQWLVLDDGSFDDLLSSTYTVANAIRHNGGATSLLAATFHLDFDGSLAAPNSSGARAILEAYLIYRFDRNRYYPFIPSNESPDDGERDSQTEAQLGASLRSHGLSVEDDTREWLALWDIPF